MSCSRREERIGSRLKWSRNCGWHCRGCGREGFEVLGEQRLLRKRSSWWLCDYRLFCRGRSCHGLLNRNRWLKWRNCWLKRMNSLRNEGFSCRRRLWRGSHRLYWLCLHRRRNRRRFRLGLRFNWWMGYSCGGKEVQRLLI